MANLILTTEMVGINMAITKMEYRAYLSEKKIRLVSFDLSSSIHECTVCHKRWLARPSNVMRNQSGCKRCYLRNKHEAARLDGEKRYAALCKKRKVKLIEHYKTMLTAVKHRCLLCDTVWAVKPNDVANAKDNGNRCPTCALEKSSVRMRMSEKEMRKRIEANGKVSIVEFFDRAVNEKPKVKVKCLKCGFVFISTAYDLMYSKSGCTGPCKISASAQGMSKAKDYMLGKCRIEVQGYEGVALDWIQAQGTRPENICAGLRQSEIPVISYWFQGKPRKYFPDFFLPENNRLVEVKSTYTVGLTNSVWFRKLREKARACKDAGYDFKLLVFSAKGELLKTPKGLTELTYKKFCREFHRLNGDVH